MHNLGSPNPQDLRANLFAPLVTWSSESPDSLAGTQTSVRIELEAVEGTISQVKAKNSAYEGDSESLITGHRYLQAETTEPLCESLDFNQEGPPTSTGST